MPKSLKVKSITSVAGSSIITSDQFGSMLDITLQKLCVIDECWRWTVLSAVAKSSLISPRLNDIKLVQHQVRSTMSMQKAMKMLQRMRLLMHFFPTFHVARKVKGSAL